jgi:hypothetical protein
MSKFLIGELAQRHIQRLANGKVFFRINAPLTVKHVVKCRPVKTGLFCNPDLLKPLFLEVGQDRPAHVSFLLFRLNHPPCSVFLCASII